MKRMVLLLILGALSVPAHAVRLGDVKVQPNNSVDPLKEKTSIRLIPGINVGYNKLLKGYDGYEDLGNVGVDLNIQPWKAAAYPTRIKNNLLLRLSYDYFPLQVPKQNAGLEEDLSSINMAIVYQFHRLNRQADQRWLPFFSLGYGRYFDVVTLDTKATGKRTARRQYSGYVASIGLALPWFQDFPIRVVPEIRYHHVKVVDDAATNMTYQVSLNWWPRSKL